jgi:CBS domain-containing protein
VTYTDILRRQSNSPLFLPRQLERAQTLEDLQDYADQVVEAVGALLESGARVSDIGRVVAIAHDRLLVRLLSDAEADLGPPPCPYAWLVLGSEGRYEQTLRTDQDNALIYADGAPPAAAGYFAALAERIVDQLAACGFPRCPGEIMASNQQWRQPLAVWQGYFRQWIGVPDEEALLRVAIFFDYRQVYGDLDAEAGLRPIIAAARDRRVFLGRLARAALRQPAPLGLLSQLVLERKGAQRDLLDLKLRGTAMIVDLARLYALEGNVAATNTHVRLRQSAGRGSLSAAQAEELTAAFELLSLIRLRHQYQQIQGGQEPTNYLAVSGLTPLERRELKEALRAVKRAQDEVEMAFQTAKMA